MKYWYVVHTKPNCEGFADASLRHLQVEAFFPLVKEAKTIRGNHQVSIGPLFPGYLFVRCELPSQYRTVAYARGVKQFVSFGSGPARVDEAIVQAIRNQGIQRSRELSDSDFSRGQVVRIKSGPLYGLEAVFERKMSGEHRAVLLVQAMSYQARVILEAQHVSNF